MPAGPSLTICAAHIGSKQRPVSRAREARCKGHYLLLHHHRLRRLRLGRRRHLATTCICQCWAFQRVLQKPLILWC